MHDWRKYMHDSLVRDGGDKTFYDHNFANLVIRWRSFVALQKQLRGFPT